MSPEESTENEAVPPAWRIAQGVAVLLVLGLFLYSLSDILTPFILFGVLVVVLIPFRGAPGHALLIGLAAVLTGLWILETTGFLLAPFVLALVLAYILDPLVDWLQGWNLSRTLAISTLILPLGLILAALVFWGIPALAEQIGNLARQVPDMLSRLVGWIESFRGRVVRWDIPVVDEEALLERLRTVEPADVVAFLEARMAEVGQRIWAGILGLGRGIGSAVTIAGYVILTPVLTFFLLRDWDHLVDKVVDLLPRTHRDSLVELGREYDDLLSRYLRGQITVALTVGAITTLGLWIAQFPYAFLLGAIVAVFSVVPYLGLVLSLIPAVGIALLSGQVLVSLLKVAVVYAVAQGLEGAVISPKIVGESVGLHPVWIVLALAVGGFFFGFVGLLIAVPVAVGLKLLILRALDRYRASKLYNGEPAKAG
ncbi:MAG: AI-2E family transporter [Longimicrobiales bacterium]|nr:AI-2E family transporter [Longimicrobiales bacterium]